MRPTETFHGHPAVAWLAAFAVPAIAMGVSSALDGRLSLAGISMIFMVAVVATSAGLPRTQAAASALLSVTALNVGFVPPRGSMSVDEGEYWWILAAMLGLSLGLNAVLGSLRVRRQEAETGQARASQLHRLAEAMAGAGGFDAMALAAAAFLREATGRPCAIHVTEGHGLAAYAAPEGEAFDERAAAWAIGNGRPIGAGTLNWPQLPLWCAPFARARGIGTAQVKLAPHEAPSPAECEHWFALVRQAGLALERERASESAVRAEQNAKAEAARNTLLSSLSHDLRTPLAGIVGSASALRAHAAQLGAAERDKLLDNLEGEARDLALMADNILQIARLSQPQSELATQWESIEDVLGAAVVRMRRRWPGASIRLNVPRGLSPVQAEAGLLAQAISNLVDNAVRHGGNPPEVSVQAGRSRDGVFVAVRDRGRGLPPGEPSELFARWRKGQASRAGGSGLGLAICQLVAEAHGGTISARRCEPGAEFRIDLPVQRVPEELA
ncbi:MAG: ATP-binding protein [Ramlibacter sp.]|nr:ATP-binding protein [Ramlibacter sp.]